MIDSCATRCVGSLGFTSEALKCLALQSMTYAHQPVSVTAALEASGTCLRFQGADALMLRACLRPGACCCLLRQTVVGGKLHRRYPEPSPNHFLSAN